MIEKLEFILSNLPNLLLGFPGQRPGGLTLTIILAILGVGGGFILGLLIGTGKQSKTWWLRTSCKIYIDVFRGLPLILLLVVIYQIIGGQRFGLNLSPNLAAMISLMLYSSAYQAEIIHSGLRAVPTQLIESARLLGGPSWLIFFQVKLPYALRVMLPALLGQTISLFKDTSVVVVIAVGELMTVTRAVLGSDVRNLTNWLPLYLFAGLLYFCVAYGLSLIGRLLEKQMPPSDLVHSLVNS
jgi:His/Glu/Gln/Arg/opine family amino acid ABC transporter permease subunit